MQISNNFLRPVAAGALAPSASQHRTGFFIMEAKDKRAEEFFKRTIKSETGCWLWNGAPRSTRDPEGYGQCGMTFPHRKESAAHRVSWTLMFGPIPEGLLVLHRCDVPRCVRPDHLFLGTSKDNAQDREIKKRSNNKRPPYWFGEKHPRAKLTWEKVKEIRARYQPIGRGKYNRKKTGPTPNTIQALAQEFHSSLAVINSIVKGRNWKGKA